MFTHRIAAVGAGAVLVLGSVLGSSTAASAETLHGRYNTKAACLAAAANYEIHGYVIFKNCYWVPGTYFGWYFITTP